MPKDEHRPRKSREDLEHVPYTKPSTTRPEEGADAASPGERGDTGVPELSLVSRDAAGPGSAQNAEVIPVGRTPLESSQTLGSFFQMSRNVNVNGGEFTSSQLHHMNLTINIGRNAGGADSVDMDGEVVPARELVLERPKDVHSVGSGESRVEENTEGVSTSVNARGPSLQENHRRTSLPIQKSSEIYFRHLAAKGRGSPLWIPEPNNMLPIEYQRKGVGIGDVGIITDSGGFDFLFNICLPVGHPINPNTMPENFKPLPHPEPRDVYANSEFKVDSYLASSLVETSRRDGGDSPGLTFESSAMDGAVLTMPTGSRSTDLRSVTAFRRYTLANAERWYQYANSVRGREARNGDLRLVVGYNSASAWGMAAFANLSEQNACRLRFVRPGSTNPTSAIENENNSVRIPSRTAYEWECSGTAVEVKSGPDLREVELLEELIDNERSDSEQRAQQPERNVYENQCLFIRTINVTLQDAVWNKISAGWEMDMAVDEDVFPASDEVDASLESSARTGNGVHRDSGSTAHSFANNHVHLTYLPGAINFHPSTVINRLLLRARPDMRMAVTEDTDWISVLDSDEVVLPEAEILFSRIMSTHEICEDNGAVFFKPSDLEATSPPSTPPPLGERVLNYPESLSRLIDPHLLPMLNSTNNQFAPSPSRQAPSRKANIHTLIGREHGYPTPVLKESESPAVLNPLLSSLGSSRNIQPLEPTPVNSFLPLSHRSESQPPSTPPPQTSFAQTAELPKPLDPERAYPTPELRFRE